MGYLHDFQTQIRAHNYAAFLRLWEEYCAGDEIDTDELKEVLKDVKKAEFAEAFGKYVENIFPLWEKLPESSDKNELFKLIVDIQTTNTETLRSKVLDYITDRFGNLSGFQDKIRLCGIRNKDSFQGSLSNFDLLSHMEKGNFVFHTGGWGVGEIIDVSMLREQISVEFDYVSGKKDLSFSNSFKNLVPIPKDHFLALRFGNPDLLEKQAKENPISVIHRLLSDLGPKTAGEIKDEMCDLVIPEAEWGKWWQNARARMKKDTLIETPEDLRAPFVLRKAELSHESRFERALDTTQDTSELIPMVYSFLRDFPGVIKNEAFKTTLLAKIEETLSLTDLSEAESIQLYFFLDDLNKKENASSKTEEIIKESKNFEALVQSIEVLAFKKKVLAIARKIRPDWKDLFLALLFNLEHNPLRDYLLAELSLPETERDLKRRLEDLWVHPARHPELFLWYFQKIAGNEKLPFADKEGKCRFFEAFFILLSHIENSSTHKEFIKKMQGIITADRFAIVRNILQGSTVAFAQEFLLLATKCHSFSDHDIKILHSLAEVVHPSLAKLRKKERSDEETSVIWTTEQGYNKVKQRMEQIATVETIENAKEIEVARSHGDLRENAEFKSALEKRARLQSELKTLSDQIHQARILTREDVLTDEVGVGTVVECKNKQGKTVRYTLLGPWDADPEKDILSFQSKLAQAMKGLSVGDSFKFQGEEFTIAKIHSYF